MIIGINAAAAIKQPRMGVEEYTYQLIKHLTMLPEARAHRFLLYVPSAALAKEGMSGNKENPSTALRSAQGILPEQVSSVSRNASKANIFDFPLLSNFEIKILHWPWPFLWTQMRLAYEVWRHKPDVLFIPVHVLPSGTPKKSVVTIHGLEYEYWPQSYSFWRRLYLHWSTKSAAKRASKIIAISENTKQDLIKLYGVKAEKINVVYHGVSFCHPEHIRFAQYKLREGSSKDSSRLAFDESKRAVYDPRITTAKPYILYFGRIETKKNIQGILEAYKILKEKHKISHELILAGAPGYGYDKNLKSQISNLKVIELGYVPEEEKWQLLSGASLFIFPSFYEGFGIPILEAQAMGVPVVTSLSSCLPETAGQGALFVNPNSSIEIARAVSRLIDDKILRDRLRQSGFENIKRFSWERCAEQTLKIILNFKD